MILSTAKGCTKDTQKKNSILCASEFLPYIVLSCKVACMSVCVDGSQLTQTSEAADVFVQPGLTLTVDERSRVKVESE